jgi:hypothetical protein
MSGRGKRLQGSTGGVKGLFSPATGIFQGTVALQDGQNVGMAFGLAILQHLAELLGFAPGHLT